MSIGNLHSLVRGAIGSVNPDILVDWLVSTGQTVALGGKSTPTYAAAVTVRGQVQSLKGQDLRKYAFLQAQGVYRAAYLFGDAQGINRVDAKGGDLILFPQNPGGTKRTWLVSAVDETWTHDGGWCRVILTLQMDPKNPKTQQ